MDEPGNLVTVYLRGRGLYAGTHRVACHDTLPLVKNLHFISQLYLSNNHLSFLLIMSLLVSVSGGVLQ